MKVFITGSTGFIGSHLIEKLIEKKNNEIFALVRNLHQIRWLRGLQVNLLQGDLFSIPDLPHDLDFVFHLAGITKAQRLADYYTVNQGGTASLFASLQAQGIRPKRFIYLSTLAAGRPSYEGIPVRENQPPQPVTCYGHSKQLGEYEVHKHRKIFSVVSLRVGPVYGPRDKDFVSYFKAVKRGILPSLGAGYGRTSLCYVKDLAAALALSAEKNIKSGEIINIAYPETYLWDEIGETAARILRKKTIKIPVPLCALRMAALYSEIICLIRGRPHILNREKLKELQALRKWGWTADTHKAQQILRFSPQFSLEQGLQETLAWYKAEGWM